MTVSRPTSLRVAIAISSTWIALACTGVVLAEPPTRSGGRTPFVVAEDDPIVEPPQGIPVPEPEPMPPAPKPEDYKPVALHSGEILAVVNLGGPAFRVKLDKPINDQKEIMVRVSAGQAGLVAIAGNERRTQVMRGRGVAPAIILLDGKTATFEEAVQPGRRVTFDQVRGPTPYVSVRTKEAGEPPVPRKPPQGPDGPPQPAD